MALSLSILYRGVLSSCNFGCSYCPFAKHENTPAQIAKDQADLDRFVDWAEQHADLRLSVFFTPWGEALTRAWYQAAIVRLSRLPHVRKVAVQTNLSASLDGLVGCRAERVALWCSYHPTQMSRRRFLAQCEQLRQLGIGHSVGMVGLKEHFTEIEAMRAELPCETYLWVNAYKRQSDYYEAGDVQRLLQVDPLFRLNLAPHASLGKGCACGRSVISVDGEGTIRRCHFIAPPIGNLYENELADVLTDRPCSNATCGCHIGYVHLDELRLAEVFGDGILERIPISPPPVSHTDPGKDAAFEPAAVPVHAISMPILPRT